MQHRPRLNSVLKRLLRVCNAPGQWMMPRMSSSVIVP